MHHAYLYFGSLSLLPALAQDARERFGFVGDHNPDVQLRSFEKFGIDEARELQAAASLKSSSGRALYIVGVSQITTEAQQALLKLFEEPQGGVVFVVLAPHGTIIATLRSRMLVYPHTLVQKDSVSGSAVKTFLASSYKARSAEVTKLLKDEDASREQVRDFLQALEQALYQALEKSKNKKELAVALEDIAQVRSYANDRSPSLKMLLEHLALALPTIK
jgi:DNA polymerase III delta prime subunit